MLLCLGFDWLGKTSPSEEIAEGIESRERTFFEMVTSNV